MNFVCRNIFKKHLHLKPHQPLATQYCRHTHQTHWLITMQRTLFFQRTKRVNRPTLSKDKSTETLKFAVNLSDLFHFTLGFKLKPYRTSD